MDPRNYFELRLQRNENRLSTLKQTSFILSMSRLLVFLITAAMVYLFWGNNAVVAISFVLGFAGFLFLVARYTDVRNKRNFHQELKALNELELEVLNGDLSGLEDGAEFLDDDHPYNRDIDLFGPGSLFQMVNRTGTENGKKKLADLLNANEIDDIPEKQRAIRELRDIPDWRQDYQVTASMIKVEVPATAIIEWTHNYQTVIPKLFSFFPLVYGAISLTAIILYGMGVISGNTLLYEFLIGLGITGLYVKKVSKLNNSAGKMRETVGQYGKLIRFIEEQQFTSERLRNIKQNLIGKVPVLQNC